MRLAVIGLGAIAEKAYLPLLAGRRGMTLLACSRSAETVEEQLDRYPFAKGTTDLEELLGWGPDAALVLSPYPTHFDITRALLSHGVDTYVEKPLTTSSEKSEQLTELAADRGCLLMVGFNRRFAPLHRAVRARWGDRPVRFSLLEKHRPDPVFPDLEANYLDDVIHQIDLLRYFCGEAHPIATRFQLREGELLASYSSFRLRAGGMGVVAISRAAGRWRERYQLHGGGVSVYVEAFDEARWLDDQGERRFSREQYGSWTSHLRLRGFEGELDHFFDCLETRREPETSGRESVKTQQLLEGALEEAGRVR